MLTPSQMQTLARLDDIFRALEEIEDKVRMSSVTERDQKFLNALEVFHTNWLKDQ